MTRTDTLEPPAPASQTTPIGNEEREKALAPYLDQLVAARAERSADPPAIPVGGGIDMVLDAWEWEAVREYETGLDPDGHPWPIFVLEGLAFEAKCARRDQQSETGDLAPDELVLEAAVGLAIFRELQTTVDEFLRCGRMKDVKRLSAIRNRIRQGVERLRSLIVADLQGAVEAKARAMIANRTLPQPEAPDEGGDEERDMAGRPRPRPTQYRKDAKPVRITVYDVPEKISQALGRLLAVLVVCVAIWAGLTLTRHSYDGPPELTIEQFRHVAFVRGVEARPPSLYVDLDTHSWKGLSLEERTRAIREVGIVAEKAGYSGVHFWTRDRGTVGRWSKRNGVEVIPDRPEPT